MHMKDTSSYFSAKRHLDMYWERAVSGTCCRAELLAYCQDGEVDG